MGYYHPQFVHFAIALLALAADRHPNDPEVVQLVTEYSDVARLKQRLDSLK